MGRGLAATLVALLMGTLAATPAAAQPMPVPWDGHNPFNCLNQDVGTGVDFPAPGADPFCVEFDKTQQNVTDLGIVDFLANEPARTAAAVAKCFYFQRDHWTGSIVQGEQPEIWHWDGSYFFNKATGEGGVSLRNLRIGGQPFDATPYVPDSFKPYVYPGGGGAGRITNDIPADPTCAAKVDTPSEKAQVYYHLQPGGPIHGARVGPAKLRTSRADLLAAFGPPHRRVDSTDRYDVEGGGQLRLRYRSGDVAAILTTAPANTYGANAPGGSFSGHGAVLKLGKTRVYEIPRVPNRLFFGVRGGRISWIALIDPTQIRSLGSIERSLNRLR